MTRAALAGLCLAIGACAATGPEREAGVVRTAVDAGKLACGVAEAKRIELTEEQKRWCDGR